MFTTKSLRNSFENCQKMPPASTRTWHHACLLQKGFAGRRIWALFLFFNAVFDRSWHGFRSNSVNNDKTQAVLPSGNRRWAWESARTQFECTCTVTVVDMRLFRFFIGHSLTWTHDTPMNDLGCSGSSPSVAFWEAYFTFSWKNLILHLVRNATIATSRAPWLWFIGKSINLLFHSFGQSFRLEKNAIFLK